LAREGLTTFAKATVVRRSFSEGGSPRPNPLKSREADVQVVVVPFEPLREAVDDEHRIVEEDSGLRKLLSGQHHELSRQGVIVGRIVDVRRTWLSVVTERTEIDVTAIFVRRVRRKRSSAPAADVADEDRKRVSFSPLDPLRRAPG